MKIHNLFKKILTSVFVSLIITVSASSVFAVSYQTPTNIPDTFVPLEPLSKEQQETFDALSEKVTAPPNSRTRTLLPPAVDNSDTKYFPPIGDQGSLGSCADFAEIYYTYTYMYARDNNIDVKQKGNSAIFSPAFNYLTRSFTSFQHGCLKEEQMPYRDNWSPDDLPKIPEVWRGALKYKMEKFITLLSGSYSKGDRIDQTLLKEYLANRYIFVVGTHMYGYTAFIIKDNPNSTLDDKEVGKYVFSYSSSSDGGHLMTVVGYNDDIWFDKNKNGIIDEEELGAFKVANSWGKSWGNGGFLWVPYCDAGEAFDECYSLIPAKDEYKPEMLAEFEIDLKDAGSVYLNQIIIKLLKKDQLYYPNEFYKYNKVDIILPKGYKGTVALDVTPLFKNKDIDLNKHEYDFCLEYRANGELYPITIKSYKITDADGNVLALCNEQLPKTFSKSGGEIIRAPYGGFGPWELNWDPQNGEAVKAQTYEKGDVVANPPIPERKGYAFKGWSVNDKIVSFPYSVAGGFDFVAVWEIDYKQALDLDMEQFAINAELEGNLYYRVFKSERTGQEPLTSVKAKWIPAKTIKNNNRTVFNIGNLIDNAKDILIEFKIAPQLPHPEEKAQMHYYLKPRKPAIKAVIDPAAGFLQPDNTIKVLVTGDVKELSYRTKYSDMIAYAEIKDGFYYLKNYNYKATYILRSKPNNENLDGATYETAYQTGSKSVNLNIPAPANAPNVSVNWANDSINVKKGMEVSVDKEKWYAVTAGTESESSIYFNTQLNGVSIYNPKLINAEKIYIRVGAAAKKPSSKTTTVMLGKESETVLTPQDLISTDGKKIIGINNLIEYIPAASVSSDKFVIKNKDKELNSDSEENNDESADEQIYGNLYIDDKVKWKKGYITIPASGTVAYYVRFGSTGVGRPSSVIKITLDASDQWEANTNNDNVVIKSVSAPSVNISTAKDSISAKVGMEILSANNIWLKVTQDTEDENSIRHETAIGGVSVYNPKIINAAKNTGGIYVRKCAAANNPASIACFVRIPNINNITLTKDDFVTLDGKTLDLKSGVLEYIKITPTIKYSLVKDEAHGGNLLFITDKSAKWKTGQLTIPSNKNEQYFVRVASTDNAYAGYAVIIDLYKNYILKMVS